ncbi:ribbon-helix-helix DNA binding domain protein [Mycobacterium phage Neos5]|uniref:Ribbon-helix-helix DNA binding protein n=1 Tax=Mycobacterium phage Obutu TaxID=2593350 RepID=A0A514TY15_9CAUD|nr:ribbon-helix-helix DNA binding protein [Mycobacterium phage Obutu]AZF93870.1 ribbon-helix-helix DNA binding protein [Mycobacterium phage Marley1013]QYW01681.1 ribbon-helix-helix DNA binding domain protein [Mycobacterium phage Neos5]UYL86521.1 ribbon-helix-helix DNA binding domain protein [Mycobacterium phage Briakila]WNA13614.1 hypothetical protein SEA_PHAYETA_71 [Mycobacterium phage Phayeta]QDK01598.1 ribbon-helix-helix DNA binding protein [Mycobacterium phage Obutu]
MAPKKTPATRESPVFIRMASPEDRTRFKVAAAEDGLSYADLISSLLDLRDDRNRRRRAAMAHPLDTRRNAG